RRSRHDGNPFVRTALETVEYRIHGLGLEREDDHVRRGRSVTSVVTGPDLIALSHGGKPVGDHVRDPEPRGRRHPSRQETCQQGFAHVSAADDRDLDHSPPAHGLYPTRRGPKSAVPMRTNVAPSSTATSKSPDMPMDSSRIETPGILSACASAANIRNRRKCGRAFSGAPPPGGLAISPSTRMPFKAPIRSVTRANSSGLNPCLVF